MSAEDPIDRLIQIAKANGHLDGAYACGLCGIRWPDEGQALGCCNATAVRWQSRLTKGRGNSPFETMRRGLVRRNGQRFDERN